MATCFIFTKYLQEKSVLALCFDAEGREIKPLAQTDFATIKSLQTYAKTVLVLPSQMASFFELELPWLPERKARLAIPFALEEKLAQSVDLLHFSFDRKHYQHNKYHVAVIEKQILKNLMETFKALDIEYETITFDWYALHPNEIIEQDDTLLIYSETFKGAMTSILAKSFIPAFKDCKTLVFDDSKPSLELPNPQKEKGQACTFIANRLLHTTPMNICQGEFQHATIFAQIKKGYQLALGLCLVWLISLLGVNALNLQKVNAKNQLLDQKIAVIYKEFFPDAKQVISPKFRVTQLLQENANSAQSNFWNLIKQINLANESTDCSINQLRFQGKVLSITIACADFSVLETFETRLKAQNLKVNQTQASTQEKQIIATLELS